MVIVLYIWGYWKHTKTSGGILPVYSCCFTLRFISFLAVWLKCFPNHLRMVIFCNVLKRRCIFRNRSGSLFSGQKSCRCSPFFQLYHYANGLSVQYLFFNGKNPRHSGRYCCRTAFVPDKPDDPYHFRWRQSKLYRNRDPAPLSFCFYSRGILVHL